MPTEFSREDVRKLLGHSRKSVTNAYYGSFGRDFTPDETDRSKNIIESALEHCHRGVTATVPPERMDDCLQLVKELDTLRVLMNHQQAQLLWEIHSRRHAHHWIQPLAVNNAAVEAAALALLKQVTSNATKDRQFIRL